MAKKPVLITGKGQSALIITSILFWQTAREVSKYVDTFLYKKVKISSIQLIVLQSINHKYGVMKPSEIAHWTHTERHNITTMIQHMKKHGLVRVERDKYNRRTVYVFITGKGRVVLEEITPMAKEVVEQVMQSMTDDDISQLQQLIALMRNNEGKVIDDEPFLKLKYQ